jgi:hypothetical protein
MPKQAPYAAVPAVVEVVGEFLESPEALRKNGLHFDAEPGTGSAGVCRFFCHRAMPSWWSRGRPLQ